MDLENYRAAARGEKPPAYMSARRSRTKGTDLAALSDAELWAIHDGIWGDSAGAGPSLLDVKVELARRMLKSCCLCARRCGADRSNGEPGFCGVGSDSRVFFEQILWGEEAPVIPSHEVFFSGCNMRCRFCYSFEAVLDTSRGKIMQAPELAGLFDSRRREGAVNTNLIGGEPTVHLPNILETLSLTEHPSPVVWNSNFCMSGEAMRLLDGLVDLYLADFKFGNNGCAEAVGGTESYVEVVTQNMLTAAQAGSIIIRHLVMPGHIECCLRPVAEWVSANLPDAAFNLMFQYTPFYEAMNDPALGRCLTPEEEDQARAVVESCGLNTTRWNRPLDVRAENTPAGQGAVETTITIGPDGRVSIMRLHGELLGLVQALQSKGEADGRSD